MTRTHMVDKNILYMVKNLLRKNLRGKDLRGKNVNMVINHYKDQNGKDLT